MNNTYALAAICTMAAVTAFLRFFPFVVMGKEKTPLFVQYMGKVLPYSVMGMLVVYCLKNINITSVYSIIPEVCGVGVVALVHIWKRNTLLSIITGTLCYMILIRCI